MGNKCSTEEPNVVAQAEPTPIARDPNGIYPGDADFDRVWEEDAFRTEVLQMRYSNLVSTKNTPQNQAKMGYDLQSCLCFSKVIRKERDSEFANIPLKGNFDGKTMYLDNVTIEYSRMIQLMKHFVPWTFTMTPTPYGGYIVTRVHTPHEVLFQEV